MTLCPCGSGAAFDACCGPLLAGAAAPTAEALMRSRYVAFTVGNVGYLADTLAADIRAEFDQIEAESTAKNTKWQGLEVRDVVGGGPDDDTGTVEFVARFSLRGQPTAHHERSTFRREDGRWVCSGGQMDPKSPPRHVVKVGRNEPCTCGSGKKYKKCCGANAGA